MVGKPTKFEVLLTEGAEQDIVAIYNNISEFDGIDKAKDVLDAMLTGIENMSQHPERSSYPKELTGLSIKEFRQIFFKPYRVIYRVTKSKVIIYPIADGRRDMQTLLARSLLAH